MGMERGQNKLQGESNLLNGEKPKKYGSAVGRKRGRKEAEIVKVKIPPYVEENKDFNCVICLNVFSQPEIAKCGHTFCYDCIREHVKNSSQCPLCKAVLRQDDLIPNFAVRDHINQNKKSKPSSPKDLSDSELQGTFLNSLNSLADLNVALSLLQRRKESLIFHSESSKKCLVTTFLGDLKRVKEAEKETLEQQLFLISTDLERTKCSTPQVQDEIATCSSQKPTSSLGFNTSLLSMEQTSFAEKKSRISSHFKELTDIYLSKRNNQLYDVSLYENETPSTGDAVTATAFEGLDDFSETLCQVSAYHTLKPLATINYTGDILTATNIASSVEFDKNGEFFSVAGTSGKIRIFEYATVIGSAVDYQYPSSEIVCKSKVSAVGWSSYYSNHMVSSDYDGCVTLWDVAASKSLNLYNEHQRRVWSVDWCPRDPRLIASGGDDEKIRIWSTSSNRSVATIDATGNICTVKFAPNSYILACGGTDKSVYMYDIRQAKSALCVMKGHTKSVSHVKFLNGKELVSASTDNHLKLWDTTDSTLIRSFEGHCNQKNFVGLATDGHYIACGSEDNSLYVYSKALAKPLFSFKFDTHLSMFGHPDRKSTSPEFVSSVAWKNDSPVVVGANSQGSIKILQLI